MENAKRMRVAWMVVTLFLLSSSYAADRFEIDTTHSNIVFLVDHLGFSKMVGQFQEYEGEFTYDQEDFSKSKVKVTIKTASVDTDHGRRDDHLRNPDFFNAREFPEMTFVSTKSEHVGDNKGQVVGDLTLLGVTKPVMLDVKFNKTGPHPIPAYKGVLTAGFSARTKIKRSEFGMSKYLPGIGDEIELWLEVEGHKVE